MTCVTLKSSLFLKVPTHVVSMQGFLEKADDQVFVTSLSLSLSIPIFYLCSLKLTIVFLSLLSTVSLSFFLSLSFLFSASNKSVHCPCLVPTRGLIVGLMVMIIAVTDFPIISSTKQLLKCTYCCDLISTQEQEMRVCVSVCECICVCERQN